jgi:hypothetical protein
MPDISSEHVAALERRNRILIRFNAGIVGLMIVGIVVGPFRAGFGSASAVSCPMR